MGAKDWIDGGGGADTLVGGTGADTLLGGAGADTFQYRTIRESTVAVSGRDVVEDFSHAQHDRLDLHDIDADAGSSGNQAFHFIGKGAFTHHAGEVHYAFSGANTVVSGDKNGDARVDFSIVLTGHIALHADDFLL